jgi:hypothetical protein
MRLSLVVLVATALATLVAAAQPVVVNVRLTQPPPNQLRIADLWKVQLDNRTGRPVNIYLHGTAEELSVPDGIIADARSKEFIVQPSSYTVTGRDVQPVDVDEYDQRYYDALLRTGSVPTGEYKICCEAIDVETGQIVGSDCKYVTVSKLSVPILISPPDESEIVEKYPVDGIGATGAGPGDELPHQDRRGVRDTDGAGRGGSQPGVVHATGYHTNDPAVSDLVTGL